MEEVTREEYRHAYTAVESKLKRKSKRVERLLIYLSLIK